MTTGSRPSNALEDWLEIRRTERTYGNDHYPAFFTTHFGLTRDDYCGRRVLDVGCGPRGSLEWADMAAERVGLDPMAATYLELGADRHEMTYVAGYAEDMSFADGHFDVVSAFYSLDHVYRLGPRLLHIFVDPILCEISRVLKPGGLLLLLTDVYHAPGSGQPREFGAALTREVQRRFELHDERHFERTGYGIFDSVERNVPYDPSDHSPRFGVLSLKGRKPAA